MPPWPSPLPFPELPYGTATGTGTGSGGTELYPVLRNGSATGSSSGPGEETGAAAVAGTTGAQVLCVAAAALCIARDGLCVAGIMAASVSESAWATQAISTVATHEALRCSKVNSQPPTPGPRPRAGRNDISDTSERTINTLLNPSRSGSFWMDLFGSG